MATIRKRGNRWQAQVRIDGFRGVSKSFHNKEDALKWSRQTEASMDRGDFDDKKTPIISVSDLLNKYLTEVTPNKRGWREETYRINAIKRDDIGAIRISELSSQHVAAYRDRRLNKIASSTLRRDVVIFRHAIEVGIREWGVPLKENPARRLRLPKQPKSRDRRLTGEEHSKLLEVAERRKWWMKPIIIIALETAMRRGEILSMRWQHLGDEFTTLRIPTTKNGEERIIPLSPKARSVLKEITKDKELIFPTSANAFRLSWERIVAAAGIEDLRFHDLRHEAVSRLFERGLSLPEVALISGHKDPRMLFRYTHLRAEDVASKLND